MKGMLLRQSCCCTIAIAIAQGISVAAGAQQRGAVNNGLLRTTISDSAYIGSLRQAEATLESSDRLFLQAHIAGKGGRFRDFVNSTNISGDEAKTLKAAADEDVMKMISDADKLLADKLATATVFSDIAKNMEVLSPPEAEKIEAVTQNAERFAQGASILLALAGGAVYLHNEHSQASSGLALGAVVASALGALKSTFSSGSQTDKVEAGVLSAIQYASDKAQRVSVSAFLEIQLNATSTAMTALAADVDSTDKMLDDTDDHRAARARKFLGTLKEVDAFYDGHLLDLQSAVANRADSPIFSDSTKTALRNLAASVQNARSRWTAARAIYSRYENSALAYVAKFETP